MSIECKSLIVGGPNGVEAVYNLEITIYRKETGDAETIKMCIQGGFMKVINFIETECDVFHNRIIGLSIAPSKDISTVRNFMPPVFIKRVDE